MSAIENDPRYTGVYVLCDVCGRSKKPRGRDAPMQSSHCDGECPGYWEKPQVGDLWPGERREDFGFPGALVAEAKHLRAGQEGES